MSLVSPIAQPGIHCSGLHSKGQLDVHLSPQSPELAHLIWLAPTHQCPSLSEGLRMGPGLWGRPLRAKLCSSWTLWFFSCSCSEVAVQQPEGDRQSKIQATGKSPNQKTQLPSSRLQQCCLGQSLDLPKPQLCHRNTGRLKMLLLVPTCLSSRDSNAMGCPCPSSDPCPPQPLTLPYHIAQPTQDHKARFFFIIHPLPEEHDFFGGSNYALFTLRFPSA